MQQQAEVLPPVVSALAPSLAAVPVKVRERAWRRAVKHSVDEGAEAARACAVAAPLMAWYNHVGLSMLEYAGLGSGRRIHMLDTTGIEVALATATDECSGVV